MLDESKKKALYDELLNKFESATKTAENAYQEVSEDAKIQKGVGGILDGLVQLGNVNNYARNGRMAPTMGGDLIRNAADQYLSEASAERKRAIEQYLFRDQMSTSVESKLQAEQDRADAKAQQERDNQYRYDKLASEEEQVRLSAQMQRENSAAIRNDRAEERAAERDARADAKAAALDVPGYGAARTESEAKELREAISSRDDAVRDLQEVKRLGRGVSVWDREKVNKIDQLLNAAVGKLRVSLTGPGAMTDSERQMIRDTIGDPSALFSTEEIQNAKLDQLIKNLDASVESRAKQSVTNYKPKAPPPQFPRTLRKGGQTAVVNNEAEMAEANEEGWE